MNLFNARKTEALRALCKAYRYRKHTVIVANRDSVELGGGYWDEGSRSVYSLYNPESGEIASIPYPRTPTQFGGAAAPTIEIPAGWYVIDSGIFRGKKSTLAIMGSDALRVFCGIKNIQPILKKS